MIVLLVDDHVLFRQSLVRAVQSRDGDIVFLEAGDLGSALERMEESGGIDMVLLDLDLRKEKGLDVLKKLREVQPGIKALVVSMHTEIYLVKEAVTAGIQGYISKDASLDTLMEAIHRIATRGLWFAPEIAAYMSAIIAGPEPANESEADKGIIAFAYYRRLTRREQEICTMLAENQTPQEIAQALRISLKTVENHRTNIYQKLGITDRYGLYAYAKQLGITF
jgi:DNA-binding NarL/FixJ family response regulator